MLIILYQSACENPAKKIGADLTDAFNSQVDVTLIKADGAALVPVAPCWDDLLLVVFDGTAFPNTGNNFIKEFSELHPGTSGVLPIAIDASTTKPPSAAESIKSFVYVETAEDRKRLVNRVGAMLGLRWQGRDSNLFISYRAKDGKAIAEQVFKHLVSLGHRPFLDEAREDDGLTRILPGSPVQKEIDAALEAANLILLVDTPSAPQSIWIKHEVDTADSLMLPILPLCFKKAGDHRKGPGFRSLKSLMRWVDLPFDPNAGDSPLTDLQLDEITTEAERYYCEIFRRKCRVPFIVEKEFSTRDYTWKVVNAKLMMFNASRSPAARIKTSVLTHCSVFELIYEPAIKRFLDFLGETQHCNHSLFIYDGDDLLAEPEIKAISDEHADSTMIILHHQELATLIQTNFTALGAASCP